MDASAIRLELPLETGERVLWTGRPGTGIRFRRADRSAIPFTLSWFAFSVLWESWEIKEGRWGFIFWGTPFVAFGAHLAVGRFIAMLVDGRGRHTRSRTDGF